MKKLFLLTAAMLSLSSLPAQASSFHFGFFAPQPVYVAPPPPPRYVVYPASYNYYAPVEYVSYDRWNRPIYRNKQCRKHERHGREWHDHDDDDDRVYGRVWRDSGDYYRNW